MAEAVDLKRDMDILVLQYLQERNFKRAMHKLEQESGVFFNMSYLEEKVMAGEWDEVENYIAGFVNTDNNEFFMGVSFEVRKQKYFEALDRGDKPKALHILSNDLKVFSSYKEALLKEMAHLLTLENFRENNHLYTYSNTQSARNTVLLEVRNLIISNPLLQPKLTFPLSMASRLEYLINQSLNWQHQRCNNPMSSPVFETLLIDHACLPSSGAVAQPPVSWVPIGVFAWVPIVAYCGAEILHPYRCRMITLPRSSWYSSEKVVRLLYTNSGSCILALDLKGVLKLWKWSSIEQNPSGQAMVSVVPLLLHPDLNTGVRMINDVPDKSDNTVPCLALSKNDHYVASSSGGKNSLYNVTALKVVTTFLPPPPSSTFLAFHPRDNNIIAIGREDGTIFLFNVRFDQINYQLKGHQKPITGLDFSVHLNILVSSCADGLLSFWSIESWMRKKSLSIQLIDGKTLVGDTRVQFHSDQVHLLVYHESQLEIYDASKMELIRQWRPQDGSTCSISSATFSCNSQQIYAAFTDGNIGVLDYESLTVRCRIASSVYLPGTFPISQNVLPVVIAAHPQQPNQFAIGLSDGSVKLTEVDVRGWQAPPSSTNNSIPEQPQR